MSTIFVGKIAAILALQNISMISQNVCLHPSLMGLLYGFLLHSLNVFIYFGRLLASCEHFLLISQSVCQQPSLIFVGKAIALLCLFILIGYYHCSNISLISQCSFTAQSNICVLESSFIVFISLGRLLASPEHFYDKLECFYKACSNIYGLKSRFEVFFLWVGF